MRGFCRTSRRTTLLLSWMRIMRASLLPRSASLIFSGTPMPRICAYMLRGTSGRAVASAAGVSAAVSFSRSSGTAIASVPASTAATTASIGSSGSAMLLGPRRLRLADDALGDVRRAPPRSAQNSSSKSPRPLRHRAQIGRVAQHLGHRHVGLDHLLPVALRLGAEHLAAPAVQVADDVADVVVRAPSRVIVMIGSSSTGLHCSNAFLKPRRRGDLERHLRRVDVVVPSRRRASP